jgi:hypothetical protein
MSIVLLVGLAFAVLFYRIAEYEGLSPVTWALGSLALSAGLASVGLGIWTVVLGQFGLFAALWACRSHRARRRQRAP